MRLLVLVVLAGVVALVAGELVVPPRIERGIEERVAIGVPEAAAVDAELRSFPVVARVLATGRIEQLVVILDAVARPELRIASVRVDARGIEVSRRSLLDGEVDLQRIDEGMLTATITAADLEDALPGNVADVELVPGRVEVGVAGRTVGSDVSVREGRLVLDLGSLPDVGVALPGTDLFPCALAGEVVQGAVQLSCTLDEVPPYLVRRLDSAAVGNSPLLARPWW